MQLLLQSQAILTRPKLIVCQGCRVGSAFRNE
jgi:hypothetical protein